MQLRIGYEFVYECPRPTPMLLMLNVHPSRASDLVVPDELVTDPLIPISSYCDGFGNCRITHAETRIFSHLINNINLLAYIMVGSLMFHPTTI